MKARLVVLAAGASSRLGTCKALVDIGGRSPLERWIAAGRAFDPAPLVVTGAHHDEIARAVFTSGVSAGVELARNADWAAGRLGSVAVAVHARAGCDLCLAPVDVPLVEEEVLRALFAAWSDAGNPARGWLAPFSIDERGGRAYGHPFLIGRELAAHAATLRKDLPLREVRALADPLLSIQVDSASILDDLDDLADLERLRRRIS